MVACAGGRPVTRGQRSTRTPRFAGPAPAGSRARAASRGTSSEAVVLVGRIESWPPAGRRARRGGVQPHDVAGPRLPEEIGRPSSATDITYGPTRPPLAAAPWSGPSAAGHAARASARSRAEGTAPSSTSPWTRPQATLALPPAAAGARLVAADSSMAEHSSSRRDSRQAPQRRSSGDSGVALLCECGFRRRCSSVKTPRPPAVSIALVGSEAPSLSRRD